MNAPHSWEIAVAGALTRGGKTTALAEPGTIPHNGLPARPYRYHGTGRDTLTAWMDATFSRECHDDKCWRCTDPDCVCACEHPHRETA